MRQTEYESLQVFTTARPATGRAVGPVAERVDTETTNAFLTLRSESLEPGVRAVLIWDNSGAHTSGSLAVPADIAPLPLPPYSPELNPVERPWHHLRSHSWSNRRYADYEALEEAAVAAWRAVCLDRELVKSICAAPTSAVQELNTARIRRPNRPRGDELPSVFSVELPRRRAPPRARAEVASPRARQRCEHDADSVARRVRPGRGCPSSRYGRVNVPSPRAIRTAASAYFAATACSSKPAASSHRPSGWAASKGDAFAADNAVARE